MPQPHATRRDGAGPAELGGGISRGLVLLLATACGTAAANLYYAQPLLHTLAGAFGVSNGTAGLLITISQLGYVVGLTLLVPLGDLHERRGLISATMLLTAAALVLAALAPAFSVLGGAMAVVGVTSVVAQIVVPMSSSLSADHERGSVVGTVMSGLLIGILLARTVSGLIAAAAGWRTVFWFGAAAMVLLAATLRRVLPRIPPTTDLSYGGLLRSVLSLIREEAIVRQRMMLGALTFGCFSILWTSLAFLLSGAPYHYGNGVIGLFGLVGVVGALAASGAGRLADRGHNGRVTTVSILIMVASWGVMALGRTSVVPLIVGIAVLDLGVQGIHISNQSAIYALRPEARSRLTTAYMVAYFLGGAVLSAVTSTLYGSDGWSGVCVLGGGTALLSLVVWAVTEAAARRRPDSAPAVV
ncbi:MAG TPA: MFS transporter [Solirubrobacteraceae bacterium]|jgi:predicted MFS family arabinose efflux permease|nr:MFS transporter [Solirubrobacteraceae bacterium]